MKYYLVNKTLKKILSPLQRDIFFDPVLQTKALKFCKRMCVSKVQTKQTLELLEGCITPTADTTYNLTEIVLPSPTESNLTKGTQGVGGAAAGGGTQAQKVYAFHRALSFCMGHLLVNCKSKFINFIKNL